MLQLVVELLIELGARARKKVFVISSDTRVEAPNVADYLDEVIRSIDFFARRNKLPLETSLVRPAVDQTFWGKLIGLGYPPPTRWFRWCTSNMKIKPSRARIAEITSKHGSVILLLGTRLDESSDRKKRMVNRTRNFRGLNPHHDIPNAYVLTPIADWATEEVWEYLYENNPPPWERPHDTMLSLYRQAGGGECPVVMDLNTPSCGGSRFGCWTCTVVKLDKSMEGFLESGLEWMQPLNKFRNWLKIIREDKSKREQVRRNGENGPGPFTPAAREEILTELFEREKDMNERLTELGMPPRTLIEDDDIRYIQGLWSREFDRSKRAITLAAGYGRFIQGELVVPLRNEDSNLISDVAERNEINEETVLELLSLEDEFPDLNAWGAKPLFAERVRGIIEDWAEKAETADPAQ